MPRPDLKNVPNWYHRYINAVKENELSEALKNQTSAFNSFIHTIPEEKREYKYAEGKWTIKEILQHIIDTERVFGYRALRFARKDQTPLPGFEENDYAKNANVENRKWEDLIEEFRAVRKSTEYLFNSFNDEQLKEIGIASGNPVSVLGIGFMIPGHTIHHIAIIKERYL